MRNKAYPRVLPAVATLFSEPQSTVVRNEVTLIAQGLETISIRAPLQAAIGGKIRYLRASKIVPACHREGPDQRSGSQFLPGFCVVPMLHARHGFEHMERKRFLT